MITDQGEGQSRADTSVAPQHQNTADGFHEAWTHFRKFTLIRDGRSARDVYGRLGFRAGSPGAEAQATLVEDFAGFLGNARRSCSAASGPADFGAVMAKLGGDILTCWQRGAIPRFS